MAFTRKSQRISQDKTYAHERNVVICVTDAVCKINDKLNRQTHVKTNKQ